jgi:hypothetical protein
VYLVKNPCFGELMNYVMRECKGEYDECLAIAIDWNESPRFTDYTRHIMFGLEYREKDRVVEQGRFSSRRKHRRQIGAYADYIGRQSRPFARVCETF